MAIDLQTLRDRFKQGQAANGNQQTGGFWDKFYPFYKMDFDTSAQVRFIPDKDTENPRYFTVENKYHELNVNGRKVKYGCLRMFNKPCPCCDLSAQYYNDKNDTMGKKYYRKLEYITQIVVMHSPFEFTVEPGSNPVRLMSLSKSMYTLVEQGILDPEMDSNPLDFDSGYNFVITKTRKDEYANYSTSKFARRASAIDADIVAAIQPYDLKDFRTREYSAEEMEAAIQADRTGRPMETGQASGGIQSANDKGVAVGDKPPMESIQQATSSAAASDAPASDNAARARALLDRLKKDRTA